MLRNMYYFGGNVSTMDNLKASVGWSVMQETPILIGQAFNLLINQGRLELYRGDDLIAYTGKVVSKEVFMDEPYYMPFFAEYNGNQVTAAVMVVYTTESGSRYAFVPTYAPLAIVPKE